MRILVLGGAGDMGSRTVRDLAVQPDVDSVVVGDYNEAAANALVSDIGEAKIASMKVDANDHQALVLACSGADVVASALGPFYKYEALCARAAIEAGKHYVSLCDDYDAAQAVLELDSQATEQNVSVLTGLGWTPGISNVLARKAGQELDDVDTINVAWGSSASDSEGFAVILHTLHIFSGVVPSYQGGKLIQVPAGSEKEAILFPEPVGRCNVFHLGHPEPVTLPNAFPGIDTVTLKGGLSENFLNTLSVILSKLRLTSTPKRRQAIGSLLKPLLPLLGKIGRPDNPCSAVRVDVKGSKNGESERVTYGAADHMDNLTGVPLAIGAIMLGRGDVSERGVIAPETCIDPDVFIAELAKRDIVVYQGNDLSERVA